MTPQVAKPPLIADEVVGGDARHGGRRVAAMDAHGSQPDGGRGVARLRLQDEVPTPGVTEFGGQLSVDVVGKPLVCHDIDILPRDERQYPAHGLLDERVLPADLQELLRHFLAGQGPEPRSGTARHDNGK